MADDDQENEKREITEYLKLYALEECLDEIMNDVVVERPKNPYVRIGKLFEMKTLPEIMKVEFRPVILDGYMAVEASLTTNIATFSGTAPYEQSVAEAALENPTDYSIVEEKVFDAVIDINPADLTKFDECIANLSGIDRAESLALSIACCKAAARHKALPVHNYVAGLCGQRLDELAIPVPVISVLSRVVEGQPMTQDITLTPIKGGSFGSVLQKLVAAASLVAKQEEVAVPKILSGWGSPCIHAPNIQTALKMVHRVLEGSGLSKELKLGIHFRSSITVKQPLDPDNPVYAYMLDGEGGAASAGSDVAEALTGLWQEVEFITADEILHPADEKTYQLLHKRIQETVYDMKESSSDVLKYNTYGVGGDPACSMQVLIEPSSFNEIKDFELFSQSMPHNAVKLQLSAFASISEAVELVKKSRSVNWPVMVCSNDTPLYAEPVDTFLADFSVGIGAGQLLSGGIYGAAGYSKYNRLMEIQKEDASLPYSGEKFRLSVRT